MIANATVTAKTGPGVQVTAKVITGIKSFLVDLERKVLALHLVNPDPTSPQLEYDLTGVTTFTVAISGDTYTLTVS